MRRTILPLAVAAAAAALAACGGAGSLVSGGGSADHVVIEPLSVNGAGNGGASGSGAALGVFVVRQGSSLGLKAQAVHGTGNTPVGTSFTWTVTGPVTGVTSTSTASGGQTACPAGLATEPSPLPAPAPAPVPYAVTVAASSLATSPEDSSVVTFAAPSLVAPAGSAFTTSPAAYCVTISAVAADDTAGSVNVLVSQ